MTLTTGFGTASNLPVHVIVPGFRLRAQVGSDVVGIWLDAEQESLGRKVTVKVLKPEYAEHEGAKKEFFLEMDRLMQLDHSNVTRVLDTSRGETPFIVTDRTAVHTLMSVLSDEGTLGIEKCCDYSRDVARALHYLAEKGLAHKSVCPHLISMRDSGGCRLATFRFIIPLEEQQALKGKLAQDAHYVAPEQLGGEDEVGPNTPVYQIGCLMYHMLAGRPPHEGNDPAEVATAHFREPFPSLKTARPFLHPAVYKFVAACTVRSPADRPDLEQVIEGLKKLEAGKDPGIAPPGQGTIALRPRKRRRRRRR